MIRKSHDAGNIYPVIRKLEWIVPISKSKSSCFPEMNLPASMESLSIPRQFSSRYTLCKAVQCMRSCTKLRNLQKIALQMQDLKQSEVWFWSSEFGFRPKFLAQNVPFCYVSHSTMWLSHFRKLHGRGTKLCFEVPALWKARRISNSDLLRVSDRRCRQCDYCPIQFQFWGKWM